MGMPEPAHLVGVVKQCLHCSSTDNHFRYFNNGRLNQPRYLCHRCSRHFTFGGKTRTKKLEPQCTTVKEIESKEKIMKSGKNMTSQKLEENVTRSSFSAPAMETATAAQSEGGDASTPSQAENCSLRQVIYVRNVCPTCSTTYTARMNSPDIERYFGRIFYKSRYSCKDCHHTFEVDLEWPTDDASSSSRTAEPAPALVVLADEGGMKVAPGPNDEPANFLASPVCGECSSEQTWFLHSIKFWKKTTRRRCLQCTAQ